jgi:hypothetical protein
MLAVGRGVEPSQRGDAGNRNSATRYQCLRITREPGRGATTHDNERSGFNIRVTKVFQVGFAENTFLPLGIDLNQ